MPRSPSILPWPGDGVIEKLVVYPDQMQANLDQLGGLHNYSAYCWPHPSRAVFANAYLMVQRNAMLLARGKTSKTF